MNKTKQKYFELFENRDKIIDYLSGDSDILEWLAQNPEFPEESEILIASYDYNNYSGYAFMLFERAGQLYEYQGGHCSCYGLEGSFVAAKTSWQALAMRNPDGEVFGYGDQPPEFRVRLKELIAKHTGVTK